MFYIFILLFLFFYLSQTCITAKACELGKIKQKFIDFEGTKLYTEVYNYSESAKEAIIFIHGLCGNHSDGSFLYNKEVNTYMTITMDMPNHGQSGKLNQLTWNKYVKAVKVVISEYNLKKVHLIGHSMGADTALLFAKKHPEVVTDIVLLDRGYYNFSDVIKLNFTPSFYKVIEYNPDSGVNLEDLYTLVDMIFNNDITKTWDINKDVLLLAANPYWPSPVKGEPSIIDYIAMIKKSPDVYCVSPNQANLLPDLTMDNLKNYMEFLKNKIDEFSSINEKFYLVQTPFEHAMVYNATAKPELLSYAIEYFSSEDKTNVADKITKNIKENRRKLKQNSLMEVFESNKK